MSSPFREMAAVGLFRTELFLFDWHLYANHDRCNQPTILPLFFSSPLSLSSICSYPPDRESSIFIGETCAVLTERALTEREEGKQRPLDSRKDTLSLSHKSSRIKRREEVILSSSPVHSLILLQQTLSPPGARVPSVGRFLLTTL
ncbi:unnamed protein product [Pleuronectes platessa]|uniref:Uncharacterized protein n=1 Tax=Pleuronectes platessa TaxID=8262 RepID=A0A9N7Y7C6_PLEPL|nr:unnamed protein product [Pleuronectes platessa]